MRCQGVAVEWARQAAGLREALRRRRGGMGAAGVGGGEVASVGGRPSGGRGGRPSGGDWAAGLREASTRANREERGQQSCRRSRPCTCGPASAVRQPTSESRSTGGCPGQADGRTW